MIEQQSGSSQPHPMISVDNYSPAEIARLVESKGVTKAKLPFMTTLALGVLAGAFIAFGGVFSTIVSSQSALGFGPTRMLAGLGFSLGLILVVVAGAELFTGNNLIVMSWVSRHISLKSLLRNWGIVYIGNFIGAVSIALLVYFAHWWGQNDSGVGATALNIANAKVSLSPIEILFRGILANALVCLAVWLASSGRSLMDKAIAIVFPIAAFVAAGFEHSIANMYFLPLGLLLSGHSDVLQAAGLSGAQLSNLTIAGAAMNILFATVGNIIGGGVMVGLVYWFIYLRSSREPAS